MSLNQQSLGLRAWKLRDTRFGEALVLRESVVTRNRRMHLGMIAAWRISLATVLWLQATPWAASSA
jgi:hypothetical protein